MIFRNFKVTCGDCKHFEPKSDNPNAGTCQNVDIEDAEEKRDCRWYEPKNAPEKRDKD